MGYEKEGTGPGSRVPGPGDGRKQASERASVGRETSFFIQLYERTQDSKRSPYTRTLDAELSIHADDFATWSRESRENLKLLERLGLFSVSARKCTKRPSY